MQEASLLSLPAELATMVFCALDSAVDAHNLSVTCSALYGLASDDALWRTMCLLADPALRSADPHRWYRTWRWLFCMRTAPLAPVLPTRGVSGVGSNEFEWGTVCYADRDWIYCGRLCNGRPFGYGVLRVVDTSKAARARRQRSEHRRQQDRDDCLQQTPIDHAEAADGVDGDRSGAVQAVGVSNPPAECIGSRDGEGENQRPAPIITSRVELVLCVGDWIEGLWVDGVIEDGRGVFHMSRGMRYEGALVRGSLEGHGRVLYASGDVYEGGWVDARRHGHGIYTHVDGGRYEGAWCNDEITGRGVYEWYAPTIDSTRARHEYKDKHDQHREPTEKRGGGGAYQHHRYEGDYVGSRRQGFGVYTYHESDALSTQNGPVRPSDAPHLNGERYEGQWDSDRHHGRGTLWRAHDGTTYEGDWVEGQRHGAGVQTCTNGSRYEGEWRHNGAQGRGTLTEPEWGQYEGQWRNGMRHGRGRVRYASGHVYEGEWRNGVRHGKGRYTFDRSDRYYDGDWMLDRYHGRGVLADRQARYEGEWVAGRRHGHGTQVYSGESTYEGEWASDQRHGHGCMTYDAGDHHYYRGEWARDSPNGRGVYANARGWTYEGEWVDGRASGTCVMTTTRGGRYEGQCRAGYRHGTGTKTYSDGRRYEGGWSLGLRHGVGTLTFGQPTATSSLPPQPSQSSSTAAAAAAVTGVRGCTDSERQEVHFVGQWVDDRAEGMGALVLADATYRGEWHDSRAHGHGAWECTNGDRYDGTWTRGLCDGPGLFTTHDGVAHVCRFSGGALLDIRPLLDDSCLSDDDLDVSRKRTLVAPDIAERAATASVVDLYGRGDGEENNTHLSALGVPVTTPVSFSVPTTRLLDRNTHKASRRAQRTHSAYGGRAKSATVGDSVDPSSDEMRMDAQTATGERALDRGDGATCFSDGGSGRSRKQVRSLKRRRVAD